MTVRQDFTNWYENVNITIILSYLPGHIKEYKVKTVVVNDKYIKNENSVS